MKQTVVGVFDRYAAAQHAAHLLEDRGIDPDCIHVTGADDDDDIASTRASSAERQGEGTGVLSSVKHFFAELFGDDDNEAVSTYSEAVRRGGAVVKVDVEEEPKLEVARETLEGAGAVNIDERAAEWRQSGWSALADSDSRSTESMQSLSRPTGTTQMRDEGEQVIPVLKEELQVGKRTVQAGGVRVFARTVEEPVQESLELREERAHVERRPADRPASAADLDALQDRSIEVRESVERPVVQKTARVVEEVVVGKDVRQTTASIDETVRRTEVEVQPLGGDELRSAGAMQGEDYRSDFESRYAGQGAYEQFEPAYRYGATLRSDQRYAGRSWDEVERHAERDWATAHPDSPWERIKGAVRHAWERVKD
ncbi:YsnF/AvaK domain-containing protein [Ideonella sp. BN130291]|uniref:YsnF/AvaK domain-containing protein n=1 Tax=Ideonella sp. BN130291 TaxID=3112940 RepID=UPI002E260B78|nr:YsnF/AvaK domain-containing protein [Ideonella sp. BN130291]